MIFVKSGWISKILPVVSQARPALAPTHFKLGVLSAQIPWLSPHPYAEPSLDNTCILKLEVQLPAVRALPPSPPAMQPIRVNIESRPPTTRAQIRTEPRLVALSISPEPQEPLNLTIFPGTKKSEARTIGCVSDKSRECVNCNFKRLKG